MIEQLILLTNARNKSDLARMMGTTPQALGNWIARDNLPFTAVQKAMELVPGINPDWLLGYSESLMKKASPEPRPSRPAMMGNAVPLKVIPGQESKVKMLTEMSASCGDVDCLETSEEVTEFVLPFPGLRYVVKCQGNSMEPLLYSGDMVAVGAPLNMFDRLRDDVMYLVVTRTSLMVKYVSDPGPDCDYLQLSTANPNYRLEDDGRLPKEDVRSIYRVKMTLNWR